jgi:hypothetical protein
MRKGKFLQHKPFTCTAKYAWMYGVNVALLMFLSHT